MPAITVAWKEGLHFCSHTPSGELMCDESSEIGRVYPSAPELLLASLGSCIGSVLVHFAQRHDIDLSGMQIRLDYDIAEKPHRIGAIDIAVAIPRSLDADTRQTLTRVAHACLIHNTLNHPPDIHLNLSAGKD